MTNHHHHHHPHPRRHYHYDHCPDVNDDDAYEAEDEVDSVDTLAIWPATVVGPRNSAVP
jgi:hypothetical protein